MVTYDFSHSGKQDASYNSTFGRRSILECDVNPYELMSNEKLTESKESKQTGAKSPKSVALVSGQRIRVRPGIDHQDYEDVQVPKNSKPTSKVPTARFPPTKREQKKSSSVRLVSLFIY